MLTPFFNTFHCFSTFSEALLLSFVVCVWRAFFIHSLKVVLLATHFSVFLPLRMLPFPLHLWRITCLNIGFGVDNSFLSALEDCCATYPRTPWFQMSNLLSFKVRSVYGCGTAGQLGVLLLTLLLADQTASWPKMWNMHCDSTRGLCWASLLLIPWPQKAGFSWFFCLWLLGAPGCRTPLSPGARSIWETKQKPWEFTMLSFLLS